MTETLAFIAMAAGLLFTPGPTNTLLAVGGAMAGLRRSLWLMPAELAGYLIAIHLLGLVAGPFVQQSPLAQTGLRLGLALYLFWLAVRLWPSQSELLPRQAVTPAKVFVVTLLNPKALVFAFVVLPPLADGHWRAALPWLTGLCLMIVAASLSWISLGAAIAAGKVMQPRLIPRAGAVVLALFALLLALSALR
jgi:threonine/homoserine/homoserine lactone efflux protein